MGSSGARPLLVLSAIEGQMLPPKCRKKGRAVCVYQPASLNVSGCLWVCLCCGPRPGSGEVGCSQAATLTHMLVLSPGAIHLPGLCCLQWGGEFGGVVGGAYLQGIGWNPGLTPCCPPGPEYPAEDD